MPDKKESPLVDGQDGAKARLTCSSFPKNGMPMGFQLLPRPVVKPLLVCRETLCFLLAACMDFQ